MPIMNGLDLIVSIRKLERKESRSRMGIALNTALLVTELTSKVSSEINLLIQKGERTDLSQFFAEIRGYPEGRLIVSLN